MDILQIATESHPHLSVQKKDEAFSVRSLEINQLDFFKFPEEASSVLKPNGGESQVFNP